MATTRLTNEEAYLQYRALKDALMDMEADAPVEAPGMDQESAGTKGWASHKGHGHPLTQAARARCRREQRKQQS